LSIADRVRHRLDRAAFRQQFHRLHQPRLPPPGFEIHADLAAEQTLHGAQADARFPALRGQRGGGPRIGERRLRDLPRARIARHGKLRRHGRGLCDLRGDDVAKRDMFGLAALEIAQPHSLHDQLAQQRRDMQHRAILPARETRAEIERAHRHRARHADGVAHMGGNPHRELRRDQPQASRRRDLHHAAGGIDELVGDVRMFRHAPARRIVISQAGDGDAGTGIEAVAHKR